MKRKYVQCSVPPSHHFWFQKTKMVTTLMPNTLFSLFFLLRSPKSLLCVVPDISVFTDGWRCLRRIITVPLSLIRLDGLIYRTSFSFTYTPELQPAPSIRGAAGGGKREGRTEGGQEDDFLLETIHQEFTRANFHLFMQS